MNNETLNQVFSSTANSIREKSGTSASITPISFANSILNIPSPDGIFKVASIQERDNLNAKEGDIALVYGQESHPVSKTSLFNKLVFKNNLTLDPISYTDNPTVSFRHPDGKTQETPCNIRIGRVGLNGTSVTTKLYIEIDFTYMPLTQKVKINYTSEDFVHYTLSSIDDPYSLVSGNTITLPNPVSLIGNATMQTNFDNIGVSKIFDVLEINFSGLFNYNNNAWGYLDIQKYADEQAIFAGNNVYTSTGIIDGVFFGAGNEVNTIHELEERRLTLFNYLKPITSTANMYTNLSSITNVYSTISFNYINFNNITNMSHMFYHCSNLTSIPNFNTTNCTDMSYMFWGTNLTSVPNFDTSNCTNMADMLAYIDATSVPNFNTSKCTDLSGMFTYASITSVPNLDTSNCTNLACFLFRASSITSVPNFNTSKCTNFNRMFLYTNIATSPNLNTTLAVNTYMMYSGCSKLTTVPVLNLSNVSDAYHMFNACTKLTTNSLNNILKSCISAVNINAENKSLLNYILTNTSYTSSTIKGLSEYQNFINAGWTL